MTQQHKHRLEGMFRDATCDASIEDPVDQLYLKGGPLGMNLAKYVFSNIHCAGFPSTPEPSAYFPEVSEVAIALKMLGAQLTANLRNSEVHQALAEIMDVQKKMADEMANLNRRVNAIENTAAESRQPTKKVEVRPYIQWLRDNRERVDRDFTGQWIAVTDNGVLGNSETLADLRKKMEELGATDFTYVKVEDPLSP